MSCENWNDAIIGRLYGENRPDEDAALEGHLASCPRCRAELDALGRVRVILSEDEPAVPRVPRVVVLRERSRFRPTALAASLLGGALLAGAGAGLGYAVGTRQAAATDAPRVAAAGSAAAAPASAPAALDAATAAMIRDEIERRWAAREASAKREGGESESNSVSPSQLRAELAKFERKWTGARAADLDYVLDQIQASEVRTGERIGKTNQALRYVALASNPNVSAQ